MTAPRVHFLLDMAAALAPRAVAVSDPTGCDTYAELTARSWRAAEWLWTHGLRPGDRVVLLLEGSRDFAGLLYGASRLGVVAIPVSDRSGPLHLSWMLRDCEPALVVTAGDVTAIAALAPVPVEHVSSLGHQVSAGPIQVGAVPGSQLQHVALLIYTSGSSSKPRAVVCPHDQVCFAVAAITARLRYTPDDIIYSPIPVSFDYGLYQLFLSAAARALLIFGDGVPLLSSVRAIREQGATVLPLVPSIATAMAQLAARDPGVDRVRLITNTGAALTPALARRLRSAFTRASIVSMYGMTECKRIAISEPDEDLDCPGAAGRAIHATDIAVVDERGMKLQPGEIGEIWVSGPHVMRGYWQAPQATAERFDSSHPARPTLRTGDLGYLDSEGRIYVIGRKDGVFKHRGTRMSIEELEATVLQIEGVEQAAAVPPRPGSQLTVCVVGKVRPAEVLTGVEKRIGSAKVPDRCIVVDTLPTTANGKIDRRAVSLLGGGADSMTSSRTQNKGSWR